MAESRFTIGAVRQMIGLSDRQIRYYEQQGLLSPRRTPGGQRLYGPIELERLREIKRLTEAGHSLQGVRRALMAQRPQPEDSDVRSRLLAQNALRSLYPVSNRAELERVLALQEDEEGPS